jgi:hypothetical protein
MKGYQLILQYTKDQHKEVYIQELKNCAGPISHRIANKAISAYSDASGSLIPSDVDHYSEVSGSLIPNDVDQLMSKL